MFLSFSHFNFFHSPPSMRRRPGYDESHYHPDDFYSTTAYPNLFDGFSTTHYGQGHDVSTTQFPPIAIPLNGSSRVIIENGWLWSSFHPKRQFNEPFFSKQRNILILSVYPKVLIVRDVTWESEIARARRKLHLVSAGTATCHFQVG